MGKALIFLLLITTWLSAFSQEQHLFYNKNIPGTDTVWVFKPDNYDETLNYPVVYILHGYSGNYQQWDKIMNGQKYADEYNMIIVSPDGFLIPGILIVHTL